MRNFIDLVENSTDTVTLYRGDSRPVERFRFDLTDPEALFGKGFYLTDDPEVAGDYTVKGGKDGIVYRGNQYTPHMSPRALAQSYLADIMLTELKWDDRAREIRAYWENVFYTRQGDTAEVNAKFEEQRKAELRKYVDKAKAIFKSRLPEMKIVKLTTGEYAFAKHGRGGAVSRFEVPRQYLTKCLNAEAPLPEAALDVVRRMFAETLPHEKLDMRVGPDDSMPNTFDEYVEGFRTIGARYAWSNRWNGGDGENPSLDILVNGTHAGIYALKEGQKRLIDGLQALGYVGLWYQGGVRITGSGTRGGGNRLHNVYVLWDEDAVNDFRAGDESVVDPDVPNDIIHRMSYRDVSKLL